MCLMDSNQGKLIWGLCKLFIGMPYVRPAQERHVQGIRYGSITSRCNLCDADADSDGT